MKIIVLLLLFSTLVFCNHRANFKNENTGKGFVDEITGLTEDKVSIPFLSSSRIVATEFESEKLQATSDSGFRLETVGGITLGSDESTTVSAGGDFTFEATTSGDAITKADSINVNTNNEIAFESNHETTVDANDISFTTPLRDINIESHLRTTVQGVNGINVDSTFRDLNIRADDGHARLESNLITINGGDQIDDEVVRFESGGDINVRAGDIVDVNGQADINIHSSLYTNIESPLHDLEIRSSTDIDFSANIIDYHADNDIILTSVFGEIFVSAEEVIGFHARSIVGDVLDDIEFNMNTMNLEISGDWRIRSDDTRFNLNDNNSRLDFESENNIFFTLEDDLNVDTNVFSLFGEDLALVAAVEFDIFTDDLEIRGSSTEEDSDIRFQTRSFYLQGDTRTNYDDDFNFNVDAQHIILSGDKDFSTLTFNSESPFDFESSFTGGNALWESQYIEITNNDDNGDINMNADTFLQISVGDNGRFYSNNNLLMNAVNAAKYSSDRNIYLTANEDIQIDIDDDMTFSAGVKHSLTAPVIQFGENTPFEQVTISTSSPFSKVYFSTNPEKNDIDITIGDNFEASLTNFGDQTYEINYKYVNMQANNVDFNSVELVDVYAENEMYFDADFVTFSSDDYFGLEADSLNLVVNDDSSFTGNFNVATDGDINIQNRFDNFNTKLFETEFRLCDDDDCQIIFGGSVSETITVPDIGKINVIEVYVDISMGDYSELSISLNSPQNNDYLLLRNSPFDDDAVGTLDLDSGTFRATFSNIPSRDRMTSVQHLNEVVEEEGEGDWTLTVNSNNGELHGFNLYFKTASTDNEGFFVTGSSIDGIVNFKAEENINLIASDFDWTASNAFISVKDNVDFRVYQSEFGGVSSISMRASGAHNVVSKDIRFFINDFGDDDGSMNFNANNGFISMVTANDNDIYMGSENPIAGMVMNVNGVGNGEINTVGLRFDSESSEFITTVGDITFTTFNEGDMNNLGYDDDFDFPFGFTEFDADRDMFINADSVQFLNENQEPSACTGQQMNVNGDVIMSNTNMRVTLRDRLLFDSGSIVFDGDASLFQINNARRSSPSVDVVARFTQSASAQVQACNDLSFRTGNFQANSETTISFDRFTGVLPCGTNPTQDETFEIVNSAVNDLTIDSFGDFTFNSNKNIEIDGGDITFRSNQDIVVESISSIEFTSMNEQTNEYTERTDNVMTRAGLIEFNSQRAMYISTDGVDFNDHGNTGIMFHTDTQQNAESFFEPDINIRTLNGKFDIVAADNIRINTQDPYGDDDDNNYNGYDGVNNKDVRFTSTNSILSTVGTLSVDAFGDLEDDEDPENSSSLEIEATVGDFLIETTGGAIVFNAENLDFTTDTSFVEITSNNDQFYDAELGDIKFYTSSGEFILNSEQDIRLTAGQNTREATQGIQINAIEQLNLLTTTGNQIFHNFGSNNNEIKDLTSTFPNDNNNLGIVITGEEGDIDVNAANNVNIIASGELDFTSETATIDVVAENDIGFTSSKQIAIDSHNTVTFQSNTQDINLSTQGGNSAIEVYTDTTQDINFDANEELTITSESQMNFHAQNGIEINNNNNDININNAGTNENALVYSEGSILLSSLNPLINANNQPSVGVLFSSQNNINYAKADINFSPVNQFSIGSSSRNSLSTEPIVSFNAGGDDSNSGIIFKSTGSVVWDTNQDSTVSFKGLQLKSNSGESIIVNSNGAISFENSGVFNDGVFTLETLTGDLSATAPSTVKLSTNLNELTLKADATIALQALGTDINNFMQLHSANDLILDSAQGDINVDTATWEANVAENTHFTTTNDLVLLNTVGDGGLFEFISSGHLAVESLAAFTINSDAAGFFFTQEDFSDIIVRTDGLSSDINLDSGSNSFLSADVIDIDGAEGVTFNSQHNINMRASDLINFQANSTLLFDGRDSFDVDAGEQTNPAFLDFIARGNLNINATDDVELSVTGPGSFVFDSDQDINLMNILQDRSRDQGDIFFDTNDLNSRASGDLYLNSGNTNEGFSGKTDFNVDNNFGYIAHGDVSFITTAQGANAILNSDTDFVIDGGDQLHIVAGTGSDSGLPSDLLIQTLGRMDITSGSFDDSTAAKEDHLGGFSFETYGTNANLVVSGSDSINFDSRYGINAHSNNGGIFFNNANDISITTVNGVNFEADSSSIVVDSVNAVSFLTVTTQAIYNRPSIIFDAHSGSSSRPAISFDASNQVIIGAQTTLKDTSLFKSGNNLIIQSNQDFGTGISVTSGNLLLQANGNFDNSYGILMESDERNFIQCNGNLNIQSDLGTVHFLSHEDSIFNADRILIDSSDEVTISSGFDAQDLAVGISRRGISVQSQSFQDIVSEHGSINITNDDLILSTDDINDGNINFHTDGPGGNIVFTSSGINSDIQLQGGAVLFSTDYMLFQADNQLSITAEFSITLEAGGDIKIIARDGNGDATFTASDGIDITTRDIIVDSDDKQANLDQSFSAAIYLGQNNLSQASTTGFLSFPQTSNHVGRRNFFSYTWFEQNAHQCENRELTYDNFENYFCVCVGGVWRCF